VFSDLLIAFFNIAFNHNALDEGIQISRVAAAVKNLFYNADLLLVLLIGVGMVGIYDAGRIYQVPLHVAGEAASDPRSGSWADTGRAC